MTSTFRQLTRKHAEIGIILISLALIAVFASTSADKWANAYNLASIAQVTATLGIMALGVSLVIGTGEIDISVGSVFGVGAIIYLALVMSTGPVPALLVAVAAGALVGALNGYLVAFFGAPSLIITLSTLLVFRGFAIGLTEGFSFSVPYDQRSGGGDLLGVNAAVWWLLLTVVALTVFVFATPCGNRLLAVGGSEASAYSRGVRVRRVKTLAFVLSGALAALAGTLEAGKLGFADGGMGRLMELQAIAACVLGGCALAGGRISLVGVIFGAFTLSSIQSFLVVNGVQPQWFILALGLIVVAAAIGDRTLRDWALKGR